MSPSLHRLRLARLLALAACLALSPLARAAGGASAEVVHIALASAARAAPDMVAGLFLPRGDGPFPVVVYSHGRSATQAERQETVIPDPRGFVRYFVHRGFAVVAPIRPGYGATGGDDREGSGVLYDVFGNCWGRPQFARAAAAAREAIAAAVEWARLQPWADPRRVVLVGTSMGGLASVASAAAGLDGVVAYVNFAGGTGGNGHAAPEHSCGSEDMAELMSAYGARTHVPGLWLYAENDSFWGSDRPRLWHEAYARGGGEAQFVMTHPLPNADGHQLLARGSRYWIPPLDGFLAAHGL